MTDILHDGTLSIAIGRTRWEKNWKNREMLWSELVAKCSTTHRTAEKLSEYIAAKKSRQDEIKDIGGFVGGYLTGGRRKNGSVLHRQLITLDLDFARPGMWEDFTFLYDNGAAIYSTHKHSPENPRLRLLMPLDRQVFADEYVAIARYIAGSIGIEDFDHTSFRPTQFMYWPSTPKDGEYIFACQDGPWLSADNILATYHNWQDASEWPMSDREKAIPNSAIKKQGDPLEKPGIVGAFCRRYSISEVIETYLSDVYEPCDATDRYTYKEGSTAAGLVVYEDKYAFSHHGTDPVSGKLCNAFDLVRLHKFGLKDEDAREGTPGNKLPSYTEMTSFAIKDPAVRKQLGMEKMAKIEEDFADDFEPLDEQETEEPTDDSWLELLEVDKQKNYLNTINNVILIFRNDKRLKGRIAYDQFENREIALKDLPWRKVTFKTRNLSDADDAGLRHYLEKNWGITAAGKIKDALDIIVRENSFHPIRDYIKPLQWDGVSRIDSMLIDYLGVDDNIYTRWPDRSLSGIPSFSAF